LINKGRTQKRGRKEKGFTWGRRGWDSLNTHKRKGSHPKGESGKPNGRGLLNTQSRRGEGEGDIYGG